MINFVFWYLAIIGGFRMLTALSAGAVLYWSGHPIGLEPLRVGIYGSFDLICAGILHEAASKACP